MRTFSIQSGSNGNCIYVETNGVRLLFDVGVSGKTAETRLNAYGIDIHSINGIMISHDHSDHARGIGVFSRKYKIPIYISKPSLSAVLDKYPVGKINEIRHFSSGETIYFGDVKIETVSTPHDANDGVVFVVDDGNVRLGIMTDLGHPFPELAKTLATLDAVYLESNYDPQMLENGSYPWYLKNRIKGSGGHISNKESAELLARFSSPNLRWACLSHLSQENNSPQVAMQTHRQILGESFPLHLAGRYSASSFFEI